MIYKGYELLKAIADGEIKNGTKVISKDCSNNRIIYFNVNELCWKDNGESVFNSIYLLDFLNYNFKLIEDEVDIDSIEKLESITNNIDGTVCIMVKINELVQAVKQLNKKVKEAETLDIEINENDINEAIKKARKQPKED